MTTIYTKINKATGTSYTRIGVGGYLFDDDNASFDDNINFDGVSTTYTKVPAPAHETPGGAYYGFGAFTYSGGQGGIYTKVPKAT